MISGFKPIVDDNCKILILGTMPGQESIKRQEYYANVRNHFWKLIFSLLGEQTIENYKDKKEFLLNNHIAIWDVLESCDRDGSSDSSITNPKINNFKLFYSQYPKIKHVYFNGKKAEKLYMDLADKNINNDTMTFSVLPSTSPANAIQFEKKLKEWKIIIS